MDHALIKTVANRLAFSDEVAVPNIYKVRKDCEVMSNESLTMWCDRVSPGLSHRLGLKSTAVPPNESAEAKASREARELLVSARYQDDLNQFRATLGRARRLLAACVVFLVLASWLIALGYMFFSALMAFLIYPILITILASLAIGVLHAFLIAKVKPPEKPGFLEG